mmetsp:Transcript_7069/g.26490  ORF Transcript_7069/g.26490 Transcript_7069/m.26490 type:complete len:102 (+) Transcript_7069:1908-2213(+)
MDIDSEAAANGESGSKTRKRKRVPSSTPNRKKQKQEAQQKKVPTKRVPKKAAPKAHQPSKHRIIVVPRKYRLILMDQNRKMVPQKRRQQNSHVRCFFHTNK